MRAEAQDVDAVFGGCDELLVLIHKVTTNLAFPKLERFMIEQSVDAVLL